MITKTNNITRALRKLCKTRNLECVRGEKDGNLCVYSFSNKAPTDGKVATVDYVVDISSYKKEYAKLLVDKASYDVNKTIKQDKVKMSLEQLVGHVLDAFEEKVEASDEATIAYLTGKVLELTKCKADPNEVRQWIITQLEAENEC